MPQYPPLTVYNEDDEPVGEAMLEEILDKGLLHRVINVLVEDDQGNILLQVRGANVKTDPLSWDFACGGYVDAGEDYIEAAIRELQEELGIKDIQPQQLEIRRDTLETGSYKIQRFVGLFKVVLPQQYELTIDPGEVTAVRWFNKQDLRQLTRSGAFESYKVTPYTKDWIIKRYLNDEDH